MRSRLTAELFAAHAGIGLCETDTAFRLRAVNDVFARMLGRPVDRLPGRCLLELLHRDCLGLARYRLGQSAQGMVGAPYDLRFLGREGELVLTVMPLPTHDHPGEARVSLAVLETRGAVRRLHTAVDQPDYSALSTRELDVARELLGGHSIKAIADRLGISPYTARNHAGNIYRKLDIGGRRELQASFGHIV